MKKVMLPLERLISDQLAILGLTKSAFIQRCGYTNITKGLKRLNGLLDGDITNTASKQLLAKLADALELEQSVVHDALSQCYRNIQNEAAEQKEIQRINFKPNAYFLTKSKRPSQITLCGMTGGPERWLSIPLDLNQPPLSYVQQAVQCVQKTPKVPFFGAVQGFVINFTPESSVCFDKYGNPINESSKTYSVGATTVTLSNKTLTSASFRKLLESY